MNVFLLYILKSAFCLLLFYAVFKALLSNDTFFRLNRWILLVGTAICMLLPFVHVSTSYISPFHKTVLILERSLSIDETPVPETIRNDSKTPLLITPSQKSKDEINQSQNYSNNEVIAQNIVNKSLNEPKIPLKESHSNISFIFFIAFIYFLGIVICLIIIIISYYRILKLIRENKNIICGKYTLVLTNKSIAPFSWRHYIVMSADDYRDNPDEILTHEKAHLVYHHSIDLLFMQMMLALQWFNPAMWLIVRELKDVHEYQADQKVIDKGIDATKYQLLLVKKAVGFSSYTFANNFNHSKIKKRITMMLKEKSNRWNRLKLLLLIPASMLAIYVFANPKSSRESEKETVPFVIPLNKGMNNLQDGKTENMEKNKPYVLLFNYKNGTKRDFVIDNDVKSLSEFFSKGKDAHKYFVTNTGMVDGNLQSDIHVETVDEKIKEGLDYVTIIASENTSNKITDSLENDLKKNCVKDAKVETCTLLNQYPVCNRLVKPSYNVIINKYGNILLSNKEISSKKDFYDEFEKFITSNEYKDSILLVLQYDKDALFKDVYNVDNIIYKYQTDHKGTKPYISFNEAEMVDLTGDIPTSNGTITILINGDLQKTISIDATKIDNKFKFDIPDAKKIDYVVLKAQGDIRMGTINKIKNELRRNYVLKIRYELQTADV